MNILFHIDEGKKWPLLIRNVFNSLKYENDFNIPMNLEIVINGEAILLFSKPETEDSIRLSELRELAGRQVVITLCQDSLQSHAIDINHLPDFVRVVPSAMLELATKQAKGYAYIRP